MMCPKLILLVVASFFLCSWAMVDPAAKSLSLGPGHIEPKIYYVGLPDLKLFSEPHSSRAHVAKLPLNGKVLRYEVEKGFAYANGND